MHMNATADGCLNHQCPEIRLVGDVNIGGIDSRFIFRNSVKGPHEVSVKEETDVVLLTDWGITFNKQPTSSLEGVGGNPWIFIEFSTKTWNVPEFLLGRCVQGLSPAFVDFSYLITATVVVSAEGCENSGGPQITMNGHLALTGIEATLTLRNTYDPDKTGTHENEDDVMIKLVLLEETEYITLMKPPPAEGAGGNPLIYFQFLDGEGEPTGDEFFLGRCNKLGG